MDGWGMGDEAPKLQRMELVRNKRWMVFFRFCWDEAGFFDPFCILGLFQMEVFQDIVATTLAGVLCCQSGISTAGGTRSLSNPSQ